MPLQLGSPRLGCVKYLNARPLIHGWPDAVQFDHPAALCLSLARSDLDVALVSSFEFLRNPIYRIADDIAIASQGEVYSVFVAHEKGGLPPDIEMDPASRTAATLLQILRAEAGEKFVPHPIPSYKLAPLSPAVGRLLIGDQAIRFREKFGAELEYWDLGQAWFDLTGLPFVFALWLVRPEVAAAEKIARQLRALRDRNLEDLDALAAEQTDFTREFCDTYYRKHLRFTFGAKEKDGLREFERLCVKRGLLPERHRVLVVV